MKLFGPETTESLPTVSGVKYHTIIPLRSNVKNYSDNKKTIWHKGGPYRLSPLPETPIPPLIHRIPRPAYLNVKPPAWK